MRFARKATGGGVPFTRREKLFIGSQYGKRPGLSVEDLRARVTPLPDTTVQLPRVTIHNLSTCVGKHCRECAK